MGEMLKNCATMALCVTFSVACTSGARSTGIFEPLIDARAIPTTLLSTTVEPARGRSDLRVEGVSGGVVVTWALDADPCLLATARGEQKGQVIQIVVERAGNPAALCAPAAVQYRYVIRAVTTTRGRYEVRVADARLGWPTRELTRTPVVLP